MGAIVDDYAMSCVGKVEREVGTHHSQSDYCDPRSVWSLLAEATPDLLGAATLVAIG